MSERTPPDARLVPVGLRPDEQWIVRHVLRDRIETGRRPRSPVRPAPDDVHRVLEKLEAGDHLFTPEELRCVRSVCRGYLTSSAVAERDEALLRRVVSRLGTTVGP